MNLTVQIIDDLTVDQLATGSDARYDVMLDLRAAGALCERVARRLSNLMVDVEQAPVDLSEPYAAEQVLLPALVRNNGRRLMILTDSTATVAAFCTAWRVKVLPMNEMLVNDALAPVVETPATEEFLLAA